MKVLSVTCLLAGISCLAFSAEVRETLVVCDEDFSRLLNQGGWVTDRGFPGHRPFRGAEKVYVATEPTFEGTVRMRIRSLKTRKLHELTVPWQAESVFDFKLPSDEQFQFEDFVFWAKGKDLNKEKFRLKYVEGLVRTTSAGACKLDVVTGNPLHVARDRQEAPVVTLTNPSTGTCSWKGRFLLADLAQHVVRMPFDVTLKAGETARFPVAWPLPGRGHWTVYADVAAEDGSSARLQTMFAVLDRHDVTPRLAAGKFRMGVNYHYHRMAPGDRRITMDALVACGAKLARTDFATWWSAQGGADKPIQFEGAEKGVSDYLSHGIDLDAICWGVPQWAATAERQTNRVWQAWAYGLPARTDLAAEYYRRLAAHFGERIAYYEIGNEWELGFYGDADEAIAIQKLCYTALKAGDQKVKVISNGWANWDSANQQVRPAKKGFPEKVMKEAHGFYDVHPIHNHGPFPSYRHAITARFLPRRREMGIDDVPWYSNETALTGVHGNEINVAEHVWKKILFAWAYGSRDYIWYNLRATGWDPNDPEQGYGMITVDHYPRPSYAAFSALAALVSGFDFDAIVKSRATREIYRFKGERNGDRQVVVAGWDSALAGGTEIRVTTDATKAWQVDFMGNRTPVAIRDGACVWVLGRRPSALLLAGATTAEPDRAAVDAVAESAMKPILAAKGPAANRPADLTVDKITEVHGFYDANPMTIHRTWKGADDASFKVWFGRRRGALAMRVLVKDDVHKQPAAAARLMSEGDCVRVSIDVAGKGGRLEFGFRLTDGGASEACVWQGDQAWLKEIGFDARREGTETDYRIVLPLEILGLTEQKLADGDLKVSVKVDDNDGEGRDLWIGLEDTVPLRFAK